MSIQVGLEELGSVAANQAPYAYFISVGDDHTAHMVAIRPAIGETDITCEVGRTSVANASVRPAVTLLWPPAAHDGYSLIVDGTARVEGDVVYVAPTRAVQHRPAPGGGNDCEPVKL